MPLDLTTLSGWTIFDPDDRGADGTVRVQVSQGSLDCTVGNSGIVITSGDLSSNILLTGTMAEFQAFFRDETTGTLIYSTAVAGSKTFTITVTDTNGQASVKTFVAEAALSAPPVVSYSGGTVVADVGVAETLDGIGVTVTDADDEGDLATASITGTDGIITVVSGNSGVAIVSGNGTISVALSGSIPNLNSLFNGTSTGTITFTSDDAASETITFSVTDIDGLNDTAVVTVSSGSPPVVTVPTLIPAITSTNKDLHTIGFSVTDADDGGGTATCVLTTTTGTIDITVGNSGVTITGGDTTAQVTFTGTITQIRNLLDDTSTGTIVWSPGAAPATGTITCAVTDSTSRSDSEAAPFQIVAATPTWTGYVSATPRAATATLTDFYAPIDLSTFPTSWWNMVAVDGRDIRVTLADNSLLPRDLVDFNRTARTGLLIVKFNHAVSAPALRIHVGTPLATAPGDADTYGRENVYASWVKGYWPYGAGTDRTGFDNDLTAVGSLSAGDTSGPFGLATTYDGVDDYAHTNVSVPTAVPVQIGAFARLATIAGAHTVGSVGGVAGNPTGVLDVDVYNGAVRALTVTGSASAVTANAIATAPGAVASGTWTFVAATFNSATVRTASRDGINGSNFTSLTPTLTTPTISLGAVKWGLTPNGGSFLSGAMAHAFVWAHNQALGDRFTSFSQTKDQANFWGTWAFSTETLTGL